MLEIVETLQTAIDEATESIEWHTEKICDVTPLSISEALITDVDMYGELDWDKALDKTIQLYQEGKLRVCIPTTTSFLYKGMTYQLCLAMGDCVFEHNAIVCKYGYKHFMDKHSIEHGDNYDKTVSKVSEKSLNAAVLRIDEALDKGKAYVDKHNHNRLAILYRDFLYIICYSLTANEITYLHNVFTPKARFYKSLKNNYTRTEVKRV